MRVAYEMIDDDFQLVFNFEQAFTVTVFREHGIYIYSGSYKTTTKPITALELHYLMVQFLIIKNILCAIFSVKAVRRLGNYVYLQGPSSS